MNKLPLARSTDIVVQELGNEILIYDLNIEKAFCLNETSAIIWQLCDGKHSIEQISRSLNRKLNKPVTEDLIWLALDQFKRDGLLERNDEFEINFGGLNRRQVVKRLGFASMVMLPVISSLVAPTAASAQSAALLALCASCSSPSQCASGSCNTFGNTCAPPGNSAGLPPGVIGGTCPNNSASCSICAAACCSGSTSYSGAICSCDPVT